MSLKQYRVASLRELSAERLSASDGQILIERTACMPDTEIVVPDILFGTRDQPAKISDFPSGTWRTGSFKINDGGIYTIRDATVHGEQGIITADNILIKDSMFHTLPHLQGFQTKSTDIYSKEVNEPAVSVDRAGYVMCGFVGNRSYAHWMVDVVPATLLPPFHDAFSETVLLFPRVMETWQKETLDLLSEIRGRSILVGETTTVHCKELLVVPSIAHSDFFPHVFRRKIVEAMKQRAGCTGSSGRRIYISRNDTTRRRLVNENEVIALAQKNGFETITMTGRSVSDQIRLFSSASHIIAPHGAGLANVTFCSPGAKLCELHMSSYVQWAMRRLAAVAGVQYGCIIGQTLDDKKHIHHQEWHIDIDEFGRLLEDKAFVN